MAALYYLKFSTAGADMIRVLRGSPGGVGLAVRVLLWPLSVLSNGLWLLGMNLAIAATSCAVFVRTRSVRAFVLGLLSLAACLVHVEAGVIYSVFATHYQNYAAFYAVFISLVAAQALADTAWSWVPRRS
jgi:predicted membrane-bound spermidine synthase